VVRRRFDLFLPRRCSAVRGCWAHNNRLQGMRGRACFRARKVLRARPAPLTLSALGRPCSRLTALPFARLSMGKQSRRSSRRNRLNHQQTGRRSDPPRPSIQGRLKGFWKVFVAVVAGLSTYVGLIAFVAPRIDAEPLSPTNPADPYTYAFKVQNTGMLDLNRVSFSCKVRGAWIDGRTAPITLVSDEDEWFHIAPLVKGGNFRQLGPTETDHITCHLFSEPFPFMLDEGQQIAVVVGYRPAFFPLRLEKEIRFSLARSTEGAYQWLPIANSRE
jgi:hypothetical protein